MEQLKTGTTTIGIIFKDGVILAADKRATAGHLIAAKHVDKVLPLDDTIGVTTAGSVADLQLLVRYIKTQMSLKENRLKRKLLPKEVASLLALTVYSNIRKFSPVQGITHFLLGGYNGKPYLYDIFPDGSISEVEDFVASGSGMEIAYGLLETEYKKDLSLEDAKNLAVRVINASLKRDIGSGGGVDVVAITKDGFKRLESKRIEPRL